MKRKLTIQDRNAIIAGLYALRASLGGDPISTNSLKDIATANSTISLPTLEQIHDLAWDLALGEIDLPLEERRS